MTLLIQNPATGMYFKNHGEWVGNEDDARQFSNALSLYHFCHTHGLNEVDIVVKDATSPNIPILGKLPFQAMQY